jgi:spore coat polysaccharide biosynthesis protein SpsF
MKKLKIVSTIEARMNSKRLPGKVMKKINGKPMIELLYLRAIKSKLIDEIVVVTSKNKSDNKLVDFLKSKKIPYFRGSENNVLQRVVMATKKFKADIIVQLTGDNPLVDSNMIDYMLKYYLKRYPKFNYITNNGFGIYNKRTVPYGLDIQIFTYKNLYNNYKKSFKKDLKEHPSLYFYREGKKKYNNKNIEMPSKWKSNLNLRLTVDTENDLKLMKMIFRNIGGLNNKYFNFEQLIQFANKNKKKFNINQHVLQRKVDLKNF